MAKSIAQAEAELRAAALDYAEAYSAYEAAYDRNGDHGRWRGMKEGEQPAKSLHPETQALCSVSCEKSNLLSDAAKALRDAVRAELRAEAL